MEDFEKFIPYVLNADLVYKSKFRLLDENKKLIGVKKFGEITNEFSYIENPYTFKNALCDTGIKIKEGKKVLYYIVDEDEGEFQGISRSDFLKLLLKLLKLRQKHPKLNLNIEYLVWRYVDTFYVIEDPMANFSKFFITYGTKIVDEFYTFMNPMPKNLLQKKDDDYVSFDPDIENGLTFICYEKFYQETEHGKILSSSEKYYLEMEHFGELLSGFSDEEKSSYRLIKQINLNNSLLRVIIGLQIILFIIFFGEKYI
jgi:hypothetical protein